MSVQRIIREVAATLADASVNKEVVNLQRLLRDRLQQEGFSPLEATEFAEDWLPHLEQELEQQLRKWDMLGIPRPLVQGSLQSTFLTFRHRNYQLLIGRHSLSKDFPGVYDFVVSLKPHEFLLVPACLLQLAGCDPIIITDGSGDGGVDCMGQVAEGSMRSLCIFAQARTSSTDITKEAVQLEYAKFRDLQKTGRFIEYLAALGKGNSADGRATFYAMYANTEFKEPAREYASREGILLRSRRQIAFWLSQNFSLHSLVQLRTEIGATLLRDLSRNLAPVIASNRRDNSLNVT